MINPLEYNEKNIPGILLLTGKTYGRSKNGKSGKFYYKCVPNDKRIPAFLVPYEQKNIGFNKNIENKFVIFKYAEWNNKHPTGTIINTIGDITNLESFYNYQLYCNNLFISIKEFTNGTKSAMKKTNMANIANMQNNPNIENRLEHAVFTIDPKYSRDLDDAISIKDNIISIYIANVPIVIEHYGLWDLFSDQVSTIYLPDRKRTMLPTILSENLCSLLENEERYAFCMDIEVDMVSGIITKVNFCNALIKVKNNYFYDDTDKLGRNQDYQKIFALSKLLCKTYKYIKEIKDSHDLVAFMMILMKCFFNIKYLINFFSIGFICSILFL
jgi:exoribonuclease R